MSVKSVKIETAFHRAALFAAAVVCVLGAYFFAKWGLANSASTRTDLKEIAEFTAAIAPNDPQTHYAAAVLLEKSFLPEDFDRSLGEYEKAVALSPESYHLWLALGRARERGGDAEGAEKSLRKALELAPNYAQVQWALGNTLLRRGKTDEAFAEIRKAVAGDAKYTDPAVAAAWQAFGGDITRVKQALGESDKIRMAAAIFLAGQKRFDESFEIWKELPAEQKRNEFRQKTEELYNQFIAEKQFRSALLIFTQISGAEANKFAVGKIANGGFEEDIQIKNAGIFDWNVTDGSEPQIGLNDRQKHGGNRSLWLIFNSADGKQFRQISQTAAVEPNRTYEFSGFYKAELKANGTLRWEIADAADGKILAATDNVSAAAADWSNLKAKFTTGGETQAVVIRLARAGCASAVCPISGRIWFDDLNLN